MSDDFYRAFEDKYRGSRELIKSRLVVYLPFVEPLLSIYKEVKAVDLGCGRGEWLELLQGSGFDASGVDLDDGMLVACRERGLNVATQDAIAALKALPDDSHVIVSGFHIAEHLPFGELQLLVQEALRVLKPAGLLILETPNPENITVGTANFYLDPTHQRPIPPQLLAFLPEHYGYAKVKVLRLHEDKSLAGKAQTSLSDVLGGVSPDYAVVAQKVANDSLLACNRVAFEHEYGLTLGILTGKFDQQAQQTSARAAIAEAETRTAQAQALAQEASARAAIAEAETRTAQAQALAQEASARADEAVAQWLASQSRADELGANSHHWWLQACALESERDSLRQSWSWRITAPARWVAGFAMRPGQKLRTVINDVVRISIDTFQLPLSRLMRAVLKRPKLSYEINQRLLRYPALYGQLLGVARTQGVMRGNTMYPQTVQSASMTAQNQGCSAPDAALNMSSLAPPARQIYADLKAAMDRRQKERS